MWSFSTASYDNEQSIVRKGDGDESFLLLFFIGGLKAFMWVSYKQTTPLVDVEEEVL